MFDREGENYLTVAPGSNHSLLPEQVAENNDLIRNASIIVLQMEIPAVTNQRILDLARDAAVPVIFNYAPIGDREVKVGPGMTWLVVNETEAAALSGLEKVDSDNAAEAANILMKKGPTHIVLTLGSKGAVYFGPESSEFVDAYKVRAVDTTAAGDTFCGALATALVEGKPVVDALRMANAAAALCVCEMGAQPSIPKIQQIENFLEAQA